MSKTETVKVKADNESGFIIINKSDLEENQAIFTGKKPAKTKTNKE